MLNVNTISFAGRKAVINSFSDMIHQHPTLMNDMVEQIAHFQKLFPNATVQTERMTDADTMLLVAQHKGPEWHLRSAAWEIGQASNVEAR